MVSQEFSSHFFFLSHKAVSTLQSCRRPTVKKEKIHLIFIFFFHLLSYEQSFAVSQREGVSLECLLWQGFEVCWLGKEGMGSSLAAC